MKRLSNHLHPSGVLPVGAVVMLALSLLHPETILSVEQGPVLGHSVYGQGSEKVMVFHDWMGDSANYEPMIPYLDPITFSYVFVDVRGYGRSRHLRGAYTVVEIARDAFRLADHLGWSRFHVVGHSMNGLTVQRMVIDDWNSGAKRLKSAVAITPVTADGYPADADTKAFLWDAIHNRGLSEQAFSALTGQRLLAAWSRLKTTRHLATSTAEAMKGYYTMWLDADFSEGLRKANVQTPLLVIGGRQDLSGFSEKHYRQTLGVWFPNIDFQFITDAGHYPMEETPVYLATLIEGFLQHHQQ